MIIVFEFILSIVIYPYLPLFIASHWAPNDIPDRFVPRGIGIFTIPIASLIFFYLFRVLPEFDPYSENIKFFRKYYDQFLLVLTVYFFYIHFVTLIWNSGIRFQLLQILAPAFGVLLFYLGDLMGQTKRNYLIGIANPWSLYSETIWKKTHVFASTLFKIAGIFTCFGLIFHSIALYFILAPLILSVLYVYIYSYHVYSMQHEHRKK